MSWNQAKAFPEAVLGHFQRSKMSTMYCWKYQHFSQVLLLFISARTELADNAFLHPQKSWCLCHLHHYRSRTTTKLPISIRKVIEDTWKSHKPELPLSNKSSRWHRRGKRNTNTWKAGLEGIWKGPSPCLPQKQIHPHLPDRCLPDQHLKTSTSRAPTTSQVTPSSANITRKWVSRWLI